MAEKNLVLKDSLLFLRGFWAGNALRRNFNLREPRSKKRLLKYYIVCDPMLSFTQPHISNWLTPDVFASIYHWLGRFCGFYHKPRIGLRTNTHLLNATSHPPKNPLFEMHCSRSLNIISLVEV
jgi:hypothetical protein